MEPVDAGGDGEGDPDDPCNPDFDMTVTTREEMIDTVHDKRPIDNPFIDMENGTKLFIPATYDPSC